MLRRKPRCHRHIGPSSQPLGSQPRNGRAETTNTMPMTTRNTILAAAMGPLPRKPKSLFILVTISGGLLWWVSNVSQGHRFMKFFQIVG